MKMIDYIKITARVSIKTDVFGLGTSLDLPKEKAQIMLAGEYINAVSILKGKIYATEETPEEKAGAIEWALSKIQGEEAGNKMEVLRLISSEVVYKKP